MLIQINGSSREDRHAVTARVRDAIAAAGGWITDFRQFSNLSVCVVSEIETAALKRLAAELELIPVRFSDSAIQSLLDCHARGEVTVSVQVTFVHGEPDLRIPQPAVPG